MAHRLHLYPHNDLLNLAHYHREVILGKLANKSRDALALDCMSCLIALAFSVEAILNFVGSTKLSNWNEKNNYHEKIKQLQNALAFDIDGAKEPYSTLQA